MQKIMRKIKEIVCPRPTVMGKGRVKVHASFDGIPYDGSIVNMGLKNPDGSVCYVIGVLKAIRTALRKGDGDTIHVVITEREA